METKLFERLVESITQMKGIIDGKRVPLRTFSEFLARLDKNPMPNERLIKTMQTSAPWDKK